MFSIVEEDNKMEISIPSGSISINIDCDYDDFLTTLGKIIKQKTTTALVDYEIVKTDLSGNHSELYCYNKEDECILTIDFKNKVLLNNKKERATKFYVSRLNLSIVYGDQPYWIGDFFRLITSDLFFYGSQNCKVSTKLYTVLNYNIHNLTCAEILSKEGFGYTNHNVKALVSKLKACLEDKTKLQFHNLLGLTKKQYNLLKKYNFLGQPGVNNIYEIYRNYIPFCQEFKETTYIEKIFELDPRTSLSVFSTLKSRDFFNFFKERNFNIMSTLNYIFIDCNRQGIDDAGDALVYLMDYIEMSEEIGAPYIKYPRFLRTYHDIAVKNKRIHVDNSKHIKFSEIKANYSFLEFAKDPNYCVIIPEDLTAIIREGSSLSHCVGTYINKIIAEETFIVFLRKKAELDKSLVTIEYSHGNFIHIKGHSNRNPNLEETAFLTKYKEYVFKYLQKKEEEKAAEEIKNSEQGEVIKSVQVA